MTKYSYNYFCDICGIEVPNQSHQTHYEKPIDKEKTIQLNVYTANIGKGSADLCKGCLKSLLREFIDKTL